MKTSALALVAVLGLPAYLAYAQTSDTLTINPTATPYQAIPSDFAGISIDHNEGATELGPVYYQLFNNLINASGSTMFLRIEGDGAMAPNNTSPAPYYNNCKTAGGTLQQPQSALIPPVKILLQNVNVKVTLGIDMACAQVTGMNWAKAEALAYYNGLGYTLYQKVAALELGNEPDNYPSQGFRDSHYTFSGAGDSYLSDWNTWIQNIGNTPSGVKYMGPSAAGSSYGIPPGATIVSQHNYPLPKLPLCADGQTVGCDAVDLLLQDSSVRGKDVGPMLYQTHLANAHAAGLKYRMAEFNDIGGGGEPGLSDTFQSALWLLDTEFEYASLGYDGTNIHTGNYVDYSLWEIKNTKLYSTYPKYYGLLAFQMAGGHGAKLIQPTSDVKSQGSNTYFVDWVTIDSNKHVHVVIINKDENNDETTTVNLPGYNNGTATLLGAPAFNSGVVCNNGVCTSGVFIGPNTFDGSTDGNPLYYTCPYAQSTQCYESFTSAKGTYTVNVPKATAMLLDLSQ
ncbi:MAG TPA: hypothetical protein VGD59_02615 [Acidisarcina sp.]